MKGEGRAGDLGLMFRGSLIFVLVWGWLAQLGLAQGTVPDDAAPDAIRRRAELLYSHTDYRESLNLLHRVPHPTAEIYGLMGRDWFMLGEYKSATEAFQKALALEPSNSQFAHWLGRTFGRRAETSTFFTAPGHASKARQYFELAVKLDPNNGEAQNDLFDYYLEAPGFLGGGFEKAEATARKIEVRDPAEGHFAAAQLADRRKQYDTAVDQLRRASELAPHDVGRVLDIAKYLGKRGRIAESDAVFEKAERMEPRSPKVAFERARAYIEEKRHLDRARTLLMDYLGSDLTPDDPSREEARQLLKQASGA